MQVSETFVGGPDTVADLLNTLAAANTIQIIQKTISSGKFVIVYDDAGPTVPPQTVEVFVGDSEGLTDRLNTLIGLGNTIDITSITFSSAHYLVVYE